MSLCEAGDEREARPWEGGGGGGGWGGERVREPAVSVRCTRLPGLFVCVCVCVCVCVWFSCGEKVLTSALYEERGPCAPCAGAGLPQDPLCSPTRGTRLRGAGEGGGGSRHRHTKTGAANELLLYTFMKYNCIMVGK